ncbi:phage holin family protein [Anaerobacillus alkaliphilus]|nr:phage holin family protein [Anaerobacillus alkaliphilus]
MKRNLSIIEVLGFIFIALGFLIPLVTDPKLGTDYAQTAAPFLSTAAFLLLYSANKMQKEELGLQRKELELQREELKQTREVFKEQEYTMDLQRIENTFFNLNSLRLTIIDNINYGSETGLKAMQNVVYSIEYNPTYFESLKGNIIIYVNCIYSILKTLDSSKLKEVDKESLLNTLVLQMTMNELKFINIYLNNTTVDTKSDKRHKINTYFNGYCTELSNEKIIFN